jgi:hypothetical protein
MADGCRELPEDHHRRQDGVKKSADLALRHLADGRPDRLASAARRPSPASADGWTSEAAQDVPPAVALCKPGADQSVV